MEELYVIVLIGTHALVFALAAIFFHYQNKKEYRETTKENLKLNKEITNLKEKLEYLTDLIALKNKL